MPNPEPVGTEMRLFADASRSRGYGSTSHSKIYTPKQESEITELAKQLAELITEWDKTSTYPIEKTNELIKNVSHSHRFQIACTGLRIKDQVLLNQLHTLHSPERVNLFLRQYAKQKEAFDPDGLSMSFGCRS